MSFGLGFWAASGARNLGAYEQIATTLITSNTASVTFDVTGLGSTYKHLEIRTTGRSTVSSSNDAILFRFNGDSTTKYSSHFMFSTGASSVGSNSSLNQNQIIMFVATTGATETTGNFGTNIISILDPFSSTKNKTVRHFGGITGTTNELTLGSGVYLDTAAITSVSLTCSSGSFMSGSRYSIYGIKG